MDRVNTRLLVTRLPVGTRSRSAFVLGVTILAVAGLAQASGMATIAAAAAERVVDAAPLVIGLEDEARVELAAPIRVTELPALAAGWHVRVEGFQHTYPAPKRPVTIGRAVPTGANLANVAAEQQRSVAGWIQGRLQHMAELVATMSGGDKVGMQENIADLRAVEADIAANGVRVTGITVRGPSADIARLMQDARVRSVAKKAR